MKLNLALYKRAILTDSRKFVLYGAWLAMGGWLFIQLHSYVSIMTAMRSFRGGGVNGLEFLRTLAYVNFIFLTLAGILGFSSSITEEKEEDCLGLLIMTGVSPLNLLISKTMARYSRGFFMLLSQMPFIIMAVTLGGVNIQQVLAVYIVLLTYMFALCCLGTFISLIFTTTKRASTVTFLILFLYIVLVLLLREMRILDWEDFVYFFPFIAMNSIFSTGYENLIIPEQFFGTIIVGLLFFTLSVFFFDKYALKEPSEKKVKNKMSFFKRGRPWSNALFWKEFNFTLAGRKGWVIQFVIYAVLASVTSYYMEPYSRGEFLVGFLAFVSLIFSTLILAVCASSMFSSEFKDGTHTSLFTLPMEISEIFWGKLFGGILYAVPSMALTVFMFLNLFSRGNPEIAPVLSTLSFMLIYIVLSGYLGLIMRVGSFVASGAILLLGWIAAGSVLFGGMSSDSVFAVMIFLNLAASVFIFILGKNKLESMIAG